MLSGGPEEWNQFRTFNKNIMGVIAKYSNYFVVCVIKNSPANSHYVRVLSENTKANFVVSFRFLVRELTRRKRKEW